MSLNSIRYIFQKLRLLIGCYVLTIFSEFPQLRLVYFIPIRVKFDMQLSFWYVFIYFKSLDVYISRQSSNSIILRKMNIYFVLKRIFLEQSIFSILFDSQVTFFDKQRGYVLMKWFLSIELNELRSNIDEFCQQRVKSK